MRFLREFSTIFFSYLGILRERYIIMQATHLVKIIEWRPDCRNIDFLAIYSNIVITVFGHGASVTLIIFSGSKARHAEEGGIIGINAKCNEMKVDEFVHLQVRAPCSVRQSTPIALNVVIGIIDGNLIFSTRFIWLISTILYICEQFKRSPFQRAAMPRALLLSLVSCLLPWLFSGVG